MFYTNNIKAAMAKLGIRQKDVASVMGMTLANFNRKLNCKSTNRFSIDEAIFLAKYLRVTMDDIFLPDEVA